jgi:hypothetical protein
MERRFSATLTGRGPNGAWTFLPIPFDVNATFGAKGRVPVTGTINGFPFRTSIMPQGDGTHAMPVDKALQRGAAAGAGDVVEVVIARDAGERVVAVPPELTDALAGDPAARDAFERMAYSHRKEYADWIAGAKKSETRVARAVKAVEMLRAGKRLR